MVSCVIKILYRPKEAVTNLCTLNLGMLTHVMYRKGTRLSAGQLLYGSCPPLWPPCYVFEAIHKPTISDSLSNYSVLMKEEIENANCKVYTIS